MSWETVFDSVEARETKEFGPLPQGEYKAFFYEAKIDETRDIPKVNITWRLVEQGEYKNRHVFSNYSLNEQGIPFLKADLRKLGIESVTAATLSESLQSLVGTEALVFIKPKTVVAIIC